MSEEYTTEQKLQKMSQNASEILDYIGTIDKKDPRSVTQHLLETQTDEKINMKEISEGICFGCGKKASYSCFVCGAFMVCHQCGEKTMKKHKDKCSAAINEENRTQSINNLITPLMLVEQKNMCYHYLRAQDDDTRRKVLVMFSNNYFKRWKVPDDNREQIALMASLSGLTMLTVKIAQMSLHHDSFVRYLQYINGRNICFSCGVKCKTRCSRCQIGTCKNCQRDAIHRSLCKKLSI